MELKDYTTIELLDELRRRAKEAPRQPIVPEYEYVTGKVISIINSDKGFTRWRYVVEISDEDVKKHSCFNSMPKWRFELYSGKFKKDTAPKVGDIVRIRCRITKALPKFTVGCAKIWEIANGEVSQGNDSEDKL